MDFMTYANVGVFTFLVFWVVFFGLSSIIMIESPVFVANLYNRVLLVSPLLSFFSGTQDSSKKI